MSVEIVTRPKPSRQHNEDIAGYYGNTFWLMDGATQLVSFHECDAHWHVKEMEHAFQSILKNHPETPLSQLAKQAIEETAAKFFSITGLTSDAPQEQRPFSTLILCRIQPDDIEYLILCDSTLAIFAADHTEKHVISDRRIDEVSDHMEVIMSVQRQGFGFSTHQFREGIEKLYDHVLGKINKPDGFYVAGQDPSAVDKAVQGHIAREEGDRILLMSDGFTRAVDTLGLYKNWSDLSQAIQTSGADHIIEKIRACEHVDSEGIEYPRSSIHDDLTVLLL